MHKTVNLVIRIEPQLAQRLDEQRLQTGCSVSEYCRRAILAQLNRTVVEAEPIQQLNSKPTPLLIAHTETAVEGEEQ